VSRPTSLTGNVRTTGTRGSCVVNKAQEMHCAGDKGDRVDRTCIAVVANRILVRPIGRSLLDGHDAVPRAGSSPAVKGPKRLAKLGQREQASQARRHPADGPGRPP
jgi:hypothetical protein